MTESTVIDVLLKERRVFNPSKEFVEQTNVKRWMDKHGIKGLDELREKARDLEWFWGDVSKDIVEWCKPYQKFLEWNEPYVKWFVGAKYNIAHAALDRHVKRNTIELESIYHDPRTYNINASMSKNIYNQNLV